MKKTLILLLTLLCCSCIQLGGPPQKLDYYRLKSVSDGAPTSLSFTSGISIKTVDFPDFLDRIQIVTHDNDYTIQISPDAYWAEPLADSILSTLRQNLQQQLPVARITLSPWETEPADAFKVELLINDFSGNLGSSTNVDINWIIRKNQEAVAQGHFTEQRPLKKDFTELSAALSSALADLSRILAEQLNTAQ